MAIQKIKGGRVNNVIADEHIGDKGSLFYNEDLGDIRLSDGITRGGIPLAVGQSGDSAPAILSSTTPPVGRPGSMWYCTATNTLHISQNGAWEPIASPDDDDNLNIGHGLKRSQTNALEVDVAAIIQPATTTTLGHITVGDGLVVDASGRLSVNIQSYQLPQATTSSIGGVIVGDGLSVDSTGTISADVRADNIPHASRTVVGGIKIGDGFVIDENGVLNVATFLNTDGGSVSTVYGGVNPLDGGSI